MAVSEVTNHFALEFVKDIDAPVETAFEELLLQLGPSNETPDGTPMPMKVEPWPGGRWMRDLGEENGHFWAHVQAIKRPGLLEFTGPLFMSYAAVSNVQFRLVSMDGSTRVTLRHSAFGLIEEEHRLGVSGGWDSLLARVQKGLEGR